MADPNVPRGGRPKRPAASTNPSVASVRKKTGDTIPDLGIPADAQVDDIKNLIKENSTHFSKVLKLDQGVSSASNWTYTKEDKVKYLVVPKNISVLAKLPGFQGLIAFLIRRGVRMKTSNTAMNTKGASKDVDSFFAALNNRIEFLDRIDENSTLKITGKTPEERGRACVDQMILKIQFKEIALDKFLPETCYVNGKGFLKHFVGLLGGASGSDALKSIPDLINTLIRNEFHRNAVQLVELAKRYVIPFDQVVKDLIRTKTQTVSKDRKTFKKQSNIHFAKISGTPFILTEGENEFFKGLEGPWNDTEALAEHYHGGVGISDITTVRERYAKAYRLKQEIIEKYSAWKARRLTALKTLAAVSLNKKEMETWRLSESSKQSALDNLPMFIRECAKEKDFEPLKKVLAGLHPRFIKDYDEPTSWKNLSAETVRKAFNLLPYYDSAEIGSLKEVFKIMNSLTSEMSVLSTTVPGPSKKKVKRKNKEADEPFENDSKASYNEDMYGNSE
jgi:hypothetical protein